VNLWAKAGVLCFDSPCIKTDFRNRCVIRNMQQNLHVLRFREVNVVFGKKQSFVTSIFRIWNVGLENMFDKVLIEVR